MNNIKAVSRNAKKFLINSFYKAKFIYTKYYEKLSIKEDEVLLQSYDGSSISGNVYYILLELCNNKKYENLKKYVVAQKKHIKEINQHFLHIL